MLPAVRTTAQSGYGGRLRIHRDMTDRKIAALMVHAPASEKPTARLASLVNDHAVDVLLELFAFLVGEIYAVEIVSPVNKLVQ